MERLAQRGSEGSQKVNWCTEVRPKESQCFYWKWGQTIKQKGNWWSQKGYWW